MNTPSQRPQDYLNIELDEADLSSDMLPDQPEAGETKTVTAETLRALPKVNLHDHLDGGLRPTTVLELAAEVGYTLPEGCDTPDGVAQWFVTSANAGNLPDYLKTFDVTCALMQTTDALIRVTREAVEDLAADGVVYAELRYAPEQHQSQGLSLREIVDATITGLEQGMVTADRAGHRIIAKLLFCGMRHAERTAEIAQLTVDYRDTAVVGFDIAGAEAGFPPALHAEAFDLLHEELIPVTIHAGESAGLDSVRSAVVDGHALRLGHGARVYEDLSASLEGITAGPVATWVRDRSIALELCPTSNVQTGVVDEFEDHPLPLLDDMGFHVTVNPDNRLVSGTSMTEEMVKLAEHFDYGYRDLYRLTVNALQSAFITTEEREELFSTVVAPAWSEVL